LLGSWEYLKTSNGEESAVSSVFEVLSGGYSPGVPEYPWDLTLTFFLFPGLICNLDKVTGRT